MNKNVRKAWVHPVDDQFLRPVDFTETVGKIKVSENCLLEIGRSVISRCLMRSTELGLTNQ